MQKPIIARSFNSPDAKSELSSARVEIVRFEGYTVLRTTFLPGMRYSRDIRPYIDEAQERIPTRVVYCQSGRLHFVQPSGVSVEYAAGGVYLVPPWEDGFEDSWVVGDEPCILVTVIAGEVSLTD